MKKLILLFFVAALSFKQSALAQNELSTAVVYRIQTFKPIMFGENSLAKSHEPKIGVGMSLSFLQFKQFRFTPGFDYLEFEVLDFAKVGNFGYSGYLSYNFNLSYEIKLKQDFLLLPYVGFGNVRISQTAKTKNFGTQTGEEFRVGLTTDYQVTNNFAFFLKTSFIHAVLSVNTNPEYVNYFGKANQIQVAIGLKID